MHACVDKRKRNALPYGRGLINVEEIRRIRNHHLTTIMEVADPGRHHLWMLKLIHRGSMRMGYTGIYNLRIPSYEKFINYNG